MTEAETLPPRRRLAEIISGADALAVLDDVVANLMTGDAIPYLGPGIIAGASVPTGPEALAAALHARVAAPSRIRTNMWSVAQFIEQRRHRRTLVQMMAEIFAEPVAPTPLHKALAGLPALRLIVDTWYDGAMRTALAGRSFTEVQGVTRALETGDVWTRTYGADGTVVPDAAAAESKVLLYKPHGAVTPAKNFLVADSDYVEVLTEIDIQTPIPDAVKALRATRGFVFMGCNFHDQMLRIFARQIIKRSAGPHVAFVAAEGLTRNELQFFATCEITPIALPVSALVERISA